MTEDASPTDRRVCLCGTAIWSEYHSLCLECYQKANARWLRKVDVEVIISDQLEVFGAETSKQESELEKVPEAAADD